MKTGDRIVWKLSVVIITIVSLVIAASVWLGHLIGHRYSHESARMILGFNSDSIVKGIEDLMRSRDIAGLDAHFADLSPASAVYNDLRLVAHPGGSVVASRSGGERLPLTLESRQCAVCHDLPDPAAFGQPPLHEITDDLLGNEQLSVLTPIRLAPDCSTTDCHEDAAAGSMVGLLAADYSLSGLDPFHRSRNARTILTATVAILASAIALRFLLLRLLALPLADLIRGTRRIADGDLDFRFGTRRKDEIGVLERSFDSMTAAIQAHEAELSHAKEYLQGVIENTGDVIITVTPEGRVETFNRGAEEMLGYGRDEVIGQPAMMIFAEPTDRDRALAELGDGDNLRNFPTQLRTRDGEIRHVLLTLSRLRDRQGNPIGTFGISKDITEERRLVRELIQSQKFAAIGEAFTGLQHAVKNMLNALKGGSYLVRSGMTKNNRERLEEGWGMVEEGIERMTRLSMNMLNYAKEWKLQYEDADLAEMARKIHEVVRTSAADRGIRMTLEVPTEPTVAPCDPRLVHMAVMDLVSNALDACAWKDFPEGEAPEIVLAVIPDDGTGATVLEVRDNGCGMTEEIRKKLFTPFFSTKKQWGTGVGLALSSRVIRLHGGSIDVESEPDRGATFRIVLPTNGPNNDKDNDKDKEPVDDPEGSADR